MGALAFFPWLRLELDFKPIAIGGFELLRYVRSEFRDKETEAIDAVLAPYAEVARQPLEEAVLLRAAGRSIVYDLDAPLIDAAFQFAEMLAFAGMARRQYFSHSGYWNRDNFRLIVQRFDNPGKGILQRTPRRDGVASLYIIDPSYRIECPPHIPRHERVHIDDGLLRALVACRGAAQSDDYIESMVTFNLANTDNPATAQHVELVLSSGALERVLNLHHGREDQLAKALSSSLRPREDLALAKCARAANSDGKSTNMRELWVRDLYRYRNEFAHGNVSAKRARIWNIREHLLLSSYVFPLVMKAQLAAAGFYTQTDSDRLDVDTFEPLACATDLFAADGDGNFTWHQIADGVRNAHRRRQTKAALAKAFRQPRKATSAPSGGAVRSAKSGSASKAQKRK